MTHIDKKFHDFLTYKDIDKIANSMTDTTVKCKCSHSIVITNVDRTICSYCGRWVYRTKEIEFRYKTLDAIRKKNKEDK